MAIEIQIQGTATSHPKLPKILEILPKRGELHCLALDQAEAEVSVVLCDDAFIQPLNLEWRGEDHATDVLSFPMFESGEPIFEGMPLGDVVINLEYAERLVEKSTHRDRVASELGVDPESLAWALEDEVEFLFIHGLLHLVGHDHAEPEEEEEMKAEERRLWEAAAPAR